ncbi:MAG: hypothetical protein ABIH23_24525, partial [bacterium]
LVLLLVFWPGRKERRAAIEEITSGSATPAIVPDSTAAPTILPAPSSSPRPAHTPAQIVSVTPAEQDAFPASNPTQKSLQVSIVDALGDPIVSGQLRVGGQEYQFTGGQISVSVPGEGQQNLVVEAEGYESATKNINLAECDAVSFVLEYLCSFEIVVHDRPGSTNPAPGAEVLLWEGVSVQRPIPHSAVLAQSDLLQPSTCVHLQLTDNIIEVQNVEKKDYLLLISDNMKPKTAKELPRLSAGDRILGLGGCMVRADQTARYPHTELLFPLENPLSPRLRVWDTIVAHSKFDSLVGSGAFLEIEKEGSRYYRPIGRIQPSARGKIATKGTTDSAGRCRFEDLPPAVYFVQARKGEERSEFLTVHPALGGGVVSLQSSRTTVQIFVRDARDVDGQLSPIEDAEVALRPSEETHEKGVFLGKTNMSGYVNLRNVPWGTYDLTVTPPPVFACEPKTMKIVVEEPSPCFKVFFSGEGRYSVSGRVLRADTR